MPLPLVVIKRPICQLEINSNEREKNNGRGTVESLPMEGGGENQESLWWLLSSVATHKDLEVGGPSRMSM